MSRSVLCAASLGFALAMVSPAIAMGVGFNVFLDGAQEVGTGDPTGSGSGSITLDPVADTVSWNVGYTNLTATLGGIYPSFLSGWHIHRGVAGTNGNVVVDMGSAMSPALGTLFPIAGTLVGSASASSTLIDEILANPSGFYVNLHSTDGLGGGFPMGAIRGQLAEPNTALLAGMGLVALAIRGRRLRHWRAKPGSTHSPSTHPGAIRWACYCRRSARPWTGSRRASS